MWPSWPSSSSSLGLNVARDCRPRFRRIATRGVSVAIRFGYAVDPARRLLPTRSRRWFDREVLVSRQSFACPGFHSSYPNRRQIIQGGTLGVLGLSLSHLLAASESPRPAKPTAKSVIVL